jgi:hypothetical protein
MKKLLALLIISFALNFVWEHAHSVLYASYQGGPVTNYILLHASLGDAVIITVIGALFIYFPKIGKRHWLIWPIGLAVAIFIEVLALYSGRWQYNSLMPIIPLLNIGLTPTIQLAITSWVTLWLVMWRRE